MTLARPRLILGAPTNKLANPQTCLFHALMPLLVVLPSCQPEEHLSMFQEPTQRYPILDRWYKYPLETFVPHQTLYWNILPDRFNSLSLKYCVLISSACWSAVYNRYLKGSLNACNVSAMSSTKPLGTCPIPKFYHLI